MSLRPNLLAFDLEQARSVVGCRSERVLAELTATFQELVEPLPEQRERSLGYLSQLVAGTLEHSVTVEDQALQYVVIALAHHGQQVERSTTLYWEALLAHLAKNAAPTRHQQVARYFLRGRQLFGDSVKTEWAYYAFFPHAQLDQLLALITEAPWSKLYDAEAAQAWLRDVARRGRDVFFFAY